MSKLVCVFASLFNGRVECHYGVRCRLYVSWKTPCKHDDQGIWIYDHVTGTVSLFNSLCGGIVFCRRLEIRIVHEDSSSIAVQDSDLVYNISVSTL